MPDLTDWAAYTKTIWQNNIPPSIDDYNLDHMEQGIYENSLRIGDLITLTTEHTNELAQLQEDLGALTDRVTTNENSIKTLNSQVADIQTNKANKVDVPTNEDFETELEKKLDKTTYNTFVNTTLPNTYYKKSETYTRSEIDAKLNNKLSKSGDTGTGNYTISGTLNVGGEIQTAYEDIVFDTDGNQGLGSYRLYVQPGNPGGKRGDVWIKNT